MDHTGCTTAMFSPRIRCFGGQEKTLIQRLITDLAEYIEMPTKVFNLTVSDNNPIDPDENLFHCYMMEITGELSDEKYDKSASVSHDEQAEII